MSRIDELIQELCPDGVQFFPLGELEDGKILKLGRGNVISKEDLKETPGDYPVYSSSAAGNGEFGKYGRYMFDDERITWSIDGGGKFFFREAHKYSVTNVSGWLTVLEKEYLNPKFLFYVLINSWASRIYNYTVKAHPSVIRGDYTIPVPPIEVQREIVSILDKFTELEAELEAELELRKKQFDYLLGTQIVAGKEKPDWVKLSDLAEFKYGYTERAQDFGDTRFIRITDITADGKLNTEGSKYLTFNEGMTEYLTQPNDILVARTGATYGKCILVQDEYPAVFASFLIRIRLDQSKILPNFYWLFAQSRHYWEQANKLMSGGGQQQFNANAIREVLVPLPSIEAQERVVNELDPFEKLKNGVSIGLPAEIAARRKQYEYYRDKLLTFKELDAA